MEVREFPSRTDRDGRFVLEASCDSSDILFSVLVPGSGSSPWQVLRAQPKSRVHAEFRIAPAGSVEGTVRDTHGRARPRAYVRFLHEIKERGGCYVYQARTNNYGHYRLEGMPPDHYSVIASARWARHVVGSNNPDEVEIQKGRTSRHDVLLCSDPTFNVVVMDAAGNRLKYRPVWVGSMTDTTDSQGQLRVQVPHHFSWSIHQIRNPLPQIWQLSIYSGDRERPDAIGFVNIDFTKPLPRKALSCRLETTGSLEIAMTRSDGTPATHASLFFFHTGDLPKTPDQDWRWLRTGKQIRNHSMQETVRSDPGQPFKIPGIPPGDYELWIWNSGEGGVRATTSGKSILHVEGGRTLVLDSVSFPGMHHIGGQITGVSPYALPAGEFDFYCVPSEGGMVERVTEATVLPDANNKFRVRFPKRGQFRALIRARTYIDRPRPFLSEWAQIDSRSAQLSSVDFKLREVPYLQLRIVYPDGAPAVGSQAVVHALEIKSEFHLPGLECFVEGDSPIHIPPGSAIHQPLQMKRARDCEIGCLPQGKYSIEIFPPGREDACETRIIDLSEVRTYVEEFVIQEGIIDAEGN
jgi:hypothetical protein